MPRRRTPEELKRLIDAGAGRTPADLVIRSARILDVITGALTPSDIAIVGDTIVGTHASYKGIEEIDGRGRIAAPGFIDTHLHIESSLVPPLEFDRLVLPHGVTTAICDPHEIANVLGAAGIRYMLEGAAASIMDIRVQLSSCVPATHFETAGARLEADDLLALRDHPKVLGLAEFMNFPGVIHADPMCLAKLAAFSDGHIDGHAPLVMGRELNAYLAAGIRTDHETTSLVEASEKLAKGMTVLIREGSVSKDLHALASLITADTASHLAFCTDDRNPLDIGEEGHLDFLIRTAIGLGVSPHHAYRVASLSAAIAFGLTDRGVVAPGKRADIVLLDDLERCVVSDVVAGGRLVTPERFAARPAVAPIGLDSVKAEPVQAKDFRVPSFGSDTPVIGVVPGRIITERRQASLPLKGSEKLLDLDQDVVKVAVVARHGVNRNIGRGFVQGFGLKRGAIASSVGHDSHNITVVGADDADMAAAVNRLIQLKGGFVVVEGGRALAEIPLPIAGLMSDQPSAWIRERLIELRAAARDLGCALPEPFLQVAFLPLPVIPHLKITDLGLFDVDRFEPIAT